MYLFVRFRTQTVLLISVLFVSVLLVGVLLIGVHPIEIKVFITTRFIILPKLESSTALLLQCFLSPFVFKVHPSKLLFYHVCCLYLCLQFLSLLLMCSCNLVWLMTRSWLETKIHTRVSICDPSIRQWVMSRHWCLFQL